jgi:hypothetical protein
MIYILFLSRKYTAYSWRNAHFVTDRIKNTIRNDKATEIIIKNFIFTENIYIVFSIQFIRIFSRVN